MSLRAHLKTTATSVSPVDVNAQAHKPENEERRRPRSRAPRSSVQRKPARRSASGSKDDSDDDGGDGGDDGGDDPDPPGDRIIVGGRCLVGHDGLRALGLTYTRVRIWQLMQKGAFPKSVTFGGRRPYWILSEVEKWIDDRFNSRFAEPDQHTNKAA